MAKRLLKINDELKDYIKDLQKNPADNEAQILAAQSLLISPSEQKELKELNKQKNERVRELNSSGLRVVLGSLTFKTGHVIHKRFSDFKTSEPASIVNPHNGGGSGGGNGFPVDDGG
jgi:predicted ATP-grasp superfamily ATP-dependent carboligase